MLQQALASTSSGLPQAQPRQQPRSAERDRHGAQPGEAPRSQPWAPQRQVPAPAPAPAQQRQRQPEPEQPSQRGADVADEAYQAGLSALELGDADAALRLFRCGHARPERRLPAARCLDGRALLFSSCPTNLLSLSLLRRRAQAACPPELPAAAAKIARHMAAAEALLAACGPSGSSLDEKAGGVLAAARETPLGDSGGGGGVDADKAADAYARAMAQLEQARALARRIRADDARRASVERR